MLTTKTYNLRVALETRNHKGSFVQDNIYQLIEIDPSGWAYICQDKTSCHYVDPDALREVINENEPT
ncbi:MAG: hypothetical protein WCA35_19215 [Kovacikia sp.]